ncbi:DUF2220 family protein (plasmid) [Rossellomorea sp. AcN35-11]|nr:DUF2220 domain-containing protein [Rossellomorea aquimaris]WJV32050.1 DUF2220 family protein [Rossellomorea sp. AcN35-11]
MNLVQELVLNLLLDKFENKKGYPLGDQTRRTMLPINKKGFPEYFAIVDSVYRMNFNESMKEAEKMGLVQIQWVKYDKGNNIEKVILNQEAVNEIYGHLKRIPKYQKVDKLLKLIGWYSKDCPQELASFYNDVISKVKGYNVPAIIDIESPVETTDFLKGLNALFSKGESREVAKRKWSIELYQNSKTWEKHEQKIIKVLKQYVLPDTELEDKELLAEFWIINNPQNIEMFGGIRLSFNDHYLELNNSPYAIGVPTDYIRHCTIEVLNTTAVVTIENLTSFYEYVDYVKRENLNQLVIYLGGFHNSIRRLFLLKVKNYLLKHHVDIPFYHWGDIDLGGIRIVRHLRDKTGIEIKPLYMSEEVFEEHIGERGKLLGGKTYIQKIRQALCDDSYREFHGVFELMIKHNKTLEQEAITL